MPHRGQETVIRVLRVWCWRDIPRRTRPTRGVSLLHAPRLANLSPFCGLQPAVCATKVIVRGAYGGPHDRTATLSQIVHLSLRCMFEPDANFDRQRRPYAPILQPVCVVR